MAELANNNVVNIDFRKPNKSDVIDGGKTIKLTKDGRVKKTPNNNKETRPILPIKSKKDIERCKTFLRDRVSGADRQDYKRGYARDLMLFICGINHGSRISDLLKMRWEDFFLPNSMEWKEYYSLKEKKTGKTKIYHFNDSFKDAVMEYLDTCKDVDPTRGGYVFLNRSGERMSAQTASDMIKLLQKNVLPCGDYNTHTLRKTFAYGIYEMTGHDIALTCNLLQHSNTSVTMRYLGLTDEIKKKAVLDLNL